MALAKAGHVPGLSCVRRYQIHIMLKPVVNRLSRSRVLRKYLGRPYLRLNQWLWRRIPPAWSSLGLVRAYGRHCHNLVLLQGSRRMSIGTFFFRNRPELECLRRLLADRPKGAAVDIAILACSKGVEVYSTAYTIRLARPDLQLMIQALDISNAVVEFARSGWYSLKPLGGHSWPESSLIAEQGELAWQTWKGQNVSVFKDISGPEMETLFDRDGDQVRVKPRFREGITWRVGDAADPALARKLSPQDVVMAKNFLCHLSPTEADKCLRNLARLVKPGGHLVVSGVDLEVRTRVARELGWTPVVSLIKEIHEGDPSLRRAWPWNYCGLEPFDPGRADWKFRYATVFQIGSPAEVRPAEHRDEPNPIPA